MDIGKLKTQLENRIEIETDILDLIKQYKELHKEKMRHINQNPIFNYGKDDVVLLKYRKRLKSINKQILNKCLSVMIYGA